MDLMNMLTGGGDPNKRSLLGFIGDLPGLLTPGSQAPVAVQGQDQLDPATLANANSMYKRQFAGAQAKAVASGAPQWGVSAEAGADAQDSYQNTVNNALKMAATIKAQRDETARRAQMDSLIKNGGYTQKQQDVLSALPPDEQAKVVSADTFTKDGDFFSMTAVGQGKAIVLDKRKGTHEIVSLPGAASSLPPGTKVHFDTANNRIVYAPPDGSAPKIMNLPEPKLPEGAQGDILQYERIIHGQTPLGRQTAASAARLAQGAADYAKKTYGMDPQDISIFGLDAHASAGAMTMAKKQAAAMSTALGSLENNLKTAIKYGTGVNGSALPLNQILNWSARDIKADPTGKRNQMQLAVRAVVGDWARIISGAMGAGGSTDNSQAEAAKDFGSGKYSGLTLSQLEKVIQSDAQGKIAAANATHGMLLRGLRAGPQGADAAQDDTVQPDGFGDVGTPQ